MRHAFLASLNESGFNAAKALSKNSPWEFVRGLTTTAELRQTIPVSIDVMSHHTTESECIIRTDPQRLTVKFTCWGYPFIVRIGKDTFTVASSTYGRFQDFSGKEKDSKRDTVSPHDYFKDNSSFYWSKSLWGPDNYDGMCPPGRVGERDRNASYIRFNMSGLRRVVGAAIQAIQRGA